MKDYLSLIKFSHTIFALPFALIGFFLAVLAHGYTFSWRTFLLMLLCMIFARSAAMAFNRYIDRDIDGKNPRTAVREIPAGTIDAKNALYFVLLNCLLFIACTYFINPICFYLSPVALLVVLGYSYTKRFTALCHLVLGLGLALAPIGAYLTVTAQFHWLPILFSFIVLTWVSGFDIIYALQDADFDKSNQLHSIPSLLGKVKALRVSTLLHVICAALVIIAGLYGGFQVFYWIGAFAFIVLLGYQHTLVKPNDLSKVNMAFFTSNGIASIVLAIFVLLELIIKI
ncbi:MAG: UbiA-like polyprenyltransferase [Chitinophagales bacterium]